MGFDAPEQQGGPAGRLALALSTRAGPPPTPLATPTSKETDWRLGAQHAVEAASAASSFTTNISSVTSAQGTGSCADLGSGEGQAEAEKQKPFTRVLAAVRVRPITSTPVTEGGRRGLASRTVVSVEAGGRSLVTQTARGASLQVFDRVLGPQSAQEEVYECCVRDLVASFLLGYNATVLAYGQTASGKTHTMGMATLPSEASQAGVLPRAVEAIFGHIAAEQAAAADDDGGADKGSQYQLKVQFLEVYQEDIVDLLAAAPAAGAHQESSGGGGGSMHATQQKNDIIVREGEQGEVLAHNAVRLPVSSAAELLAVFEQGVSLRTVGCTAMNQRSSRSHAILTLLLTHTWVDERGRRLRTRSKLNLVDLAGSERVRRTGAEGQRLRESSGINSGLLALGKVVAALASGGEGCGRAATHVPVRDSKLTRLLADALGGASATVLIACVAPDMVNLEESLNTLQFATRARHISSSQDMRTELVAGAPASAEEEVYEGVVELLQREHRMAWTAAAKPTSEGLLSCLTQDAVWEVLSSYRQGRGKGMGGNPRLAALRTAPALKSQDIMGALLREVADGGDDCLLMTARTGKGASPSPDSPLSRFQAELCVRDKQRMLEADRAAAATAAAAPVAVDSLRQKARPGRSLFSCFGF